MTHPSPPPPPSAAPARTLDYEPTGQRRPVGNQLAKLVTGAFLVLIAAVVLIAGIATIAAWNRELGHDMREIAMAATLCFSGVCLIIGIAHIYLGTREQ
jgi:succinate dehydrogenase hydrophobic anchor subunit